MIGLFSKTNSLYNRLKVFSYFSKKNMSLISYFTKLDKQITHNIEQNPDQLIKKVKKEREKWAKLQDNEKKQILFKFYQNLQKNKLKLANSITKSTGKQFNASLQQIQNGLKMIKKHLQQQHIKRIFIQDKGYGSGYYDILPYGSILQIITHHSPFLTICKYLVQALISNNSLLLHANKLSYPTSNMIESIWKQTYPLDKQISKLQNDQVKKESLLIKNFEIYQEGKNSQNLDKLLQINDVGFVSFTGDVDDGIRFYHQLASKSQNFAESQFLLQSCDSCHVLQDLKDKSQKLKKCAKIIAKGAFSNGGTLPQSIKRLFIHPQLMEQFLQYLLQEAQLYKFQPQNLQSSNLSAILKSEYQAAKKQFQQIEKFPQQFKLIYGSFNQLKMENSKFNKEDFTIFEPAIVKIQSEYPNFPYQSKIYPVPILFIHPTSSMNQTIQLINSSIFGVNHTIFTQNLSIIKNIQKIGQKIEVGTININNIQFQSDLPISPRKRSGKGFSNDLYLKNINRTKSVTF